MQWQDLGPPVVLVASSRGWRVAELRRQIRRLGLEATAAGSELYANWNEPADHAEMPAGWVSSKSAWWHCSTFLDSIRFAQLNGWDRVLILEDDALLDEDLAEILGPIAMPADCDLLYLGALHQWATGQPVADRLWRVCGSVATHAVSISRRLFEPILSGGILTHPDTWLAFNCHPAGRSYAVFPPVIVQNWEFSSITGAWSGGPDLFAVGPRPV